MKYLSQDETRRQWLLRALRLGLLGTAATPLAALAQTPTPATPGQMPAGRSIYRMRGSVSVNGEAATLGTTIRPGDEVRTGRSSAVTFVVGVDAFHLRSTSRMQLEGGVVTRALRLITGGLLSVFGRKETKVTTPLAAIGIRGTGVYLESEPDRSYICTCYGVTDLGAIGDATSTETITSEHHDAPRYIAADGAPGQRIQPAPFKNHEDAELVLLEALVGRDPPFAIFGEGYAVPRRTY
jgi:hypothetical protein